jgi:hypothetical protein
MLVSVLAKNTSAQHIYTRKFVTYSRRVLSIVSEDLILRFAIARRGMFEVIRGLGREFPCLSQQLVPCAECRKTFVNVPLDVRCLMKGLFCASEAMMWMYRLFWSRL